MKRIYDHKLLAARIKKMIREDNLYRDIHFSRTILADMLDISPARLSIIFKEEIDSSFYDFVNLQRVHYAHRLLKSPKHQSYTLDDIALISGFSCRMTLHRMYLKVYGITPGEERKSHRSEP